MMRRMIMRAAGRLVADPKFRAKVGTLLVQEVKPRAQALGRQVEPALRAVRDDVGKAAREADPLRDPKQFATALKKKFDKRRKS